MTIKEEMRKKRSEKSRQRLGRGKKERKGMEWKKSMRDKTPEEEFFVKMITKRQI